MHPSLRFLLSIAIRDSRLPNLLCSSTDIQDLHSVGKRAYVTLALRLDWRSLTSINQHLLIILCSLSNDLLLKLGSQYSHSKGLTIRKFKGHRIPLFGTRGERWNLARAGWRLGYWYVFLLFFLILNVTLSVFFIPIPNNKQFNCISSPFSHFLLNSIFFLSLLLSFWYGISSRLYRSHEEYYPTTTSKTYGRPPLKTHSLSRSPLIPIPPLLQVSSLSSVSSSAFTSSSSYKPSSTSIFTSPCFWQPSWGRWATISLEAGGIPIICSRTSTSLTQTTQ